MSLNQTQTILFSNVTAAETVEPTSTVGAIDCKGWDAILVFSDLQGTTPAATVEVLQRRNGCIIVLAA